MAKSRRRRAQRATAIASAVSAFYAALATTRLNRVLVAQINVTGFTERELASLRGRLEEAATPRDRHFPTRPIRLSIRSSR